MAQHLRYISKDLYEKGDKYAEDIQKKFFEYYGLPLMAGGRRTAAIVASQYLQHILPCISTIYVGSSESRTMIRISEKGVSKSVLMRFSQKKMSQIAESNNLTPSKFLKNYTISRNERSGVIIFNTTYSHTDQALPPPDGKLRELKPDLYWLTVSEQYILPLPGVFTHPPLPINIIYS